MIESGLISRRQILKSAACGFGYLALAGLSASKLEATPIPRVISGRQFRPAAKRIIFIYMQGGPSHVDTLDYKPQLIKRDGVRILPPGPAAPGSVNHYQKIMKPLWAFRQHGECGRWVSDLLPETARHVDKLCFIHSMQTEGAAHGPASLFLHCGATGFSRPSIGSWISYGLGTENENLPAFVTIAPPLSNGGPRNYGCAFLPPQFQGTPLGRVGQSMDKASFPNLKNASRSATAQERQLEFIRRVNAGQARRHPGDAELEGIINSYEVAWRLQSAAPRVLDISGESPETLALYGISGPSKDATENFGRQCLLARRLSEAGVRFVQITYGDNTANPAWDQHSNLVKHADHARATDLPVAGLLTDLKRRGLLEDTIVWWGSEFGRSPFSERNGTGRDHNPHGFTMWLAGGGTKPGSAYGATDELGYAAVNDKVHMHDLHATLLYLLGLDHEKLTYRHDGRDFRLTDVAGKVVSGLLA